MVLFLIIPSLLFGERFISSREIQYSATKFNQFSIDFRTTTLIENQNSFGFRISGKYEIATEYNNFLTPKLIIVARYDDKIIEYLAFNNRLRILKFFHIITGYVWHNYLEYGVSEHKAILSTDIIIPIFAIGHVTFGGGGVLNYIDLDFSVLKKQYKEHFFIQLIAYWSIRFDFYVTKYVHAAIEFSNCNEDDVPSLGYFGMTLRHTIKPNPLFSFIVDTGIGFAGTSSLAGYPDRFWISFGGDYRYVFKK